jgi:polyisoprenoid-binding protein YceI
MHSTDTHAADPHAVEIPPPGDYRIDGRRSTVTFTTRHLFGLAPVRGTFALRDGRIRVADPVYDSTVGATISAGSVDTGLAARDVTVRSERYLDTEHHPDITFASTGVEQADQFWVLHGSLTVRGRTRLIEVRVDEVHPAGSGLRLWASAEVDRYEFGLTAMKGVTGRRLALRLDVTAERVGLPPRATGSPRSGG